MMAVIHAAIIGKTGRSQLAGQKYEEVNGGVGSFFIEPDKTRTTFGTILGRCEERARPLRRAGSRSLDRGLRRLGGPRCGDGARPFRVEPGHAVPGLGFDHRGRGREELLAGRIARAAALHVVVSHLLKYEFVRFRLGGDVRDGGADGFGILAKGHAGLGDEVITDVHLDERGAVVPE